MKWSYYCHWCNNKYRRTFWQLSSIWALSDPSSERPLSKLGFRISLIVHSKRTTNTSELEPLDIWKQDTGTFVKKLFQSEKSMTKKIFAKTYPKTQHVKMYYRMLCASVYVFFNVVIQKQTASQGKPTRHPVRMFNKYFSNINLQCFRHTFIAVFPNTINIPWPKVQSPLYAIIKNIIELCSFLQFKSAQLQ